MPYVLLLHGAIGAKDQLLSLSDYLSSSFTVGRLNFSGHGGEPLPEDGFSIAQFAEQVVQFLDKEVPAGEPVYVLGYSMGGYVGMYVTCHYPGMISKLVTLGTKFEWSEAIAGKEVRMLNPEVLQQKVPLFAQQLAVRHGEEQWKEVLNETAAMMQSMGRENPLKPEDYSSITIPCLLMLGDRDKMVTLEETVNVYKTLPQSELCVVPGTGHPIGDVDIEEVGCLVMMFFLK